MTLRTGMVAIEGRLRRLVDDAGTAVWTTTELQDVLDAHKYRVHREQLERERTVLTDSAYEYRIFHSRWQNLEAGGSATFKLEDSAGTQKGTAECSADYLHGVITMTADQGGTALYLTGWTYDVPAAAADCWRERASKVASYYDAAADGHKLSRSQWFAHCAQMAEMYDRQSRPVTVRPWRSGLMEDN